MNQEFEIHYHGTTIDRLASIEDIGTLATYRPDTGLTGAWTTTILENSIRHSRKRGVQRGGIEPIILKFHLPSWWIQKNNDRKAVNSSGYDENVYCFKITIPKKYYTGVIYPKR